MPEGYWARKQRRNYCGSHSGSVSYTHLNGRRSDHAGSDEDDIRGHVRDGKGKGGKVERTVGSIIETKIVCDRCGKEITCSPRMFLTIHKDDCIHRYDGKHVDLCYECEEDFKCWIEEKEEE